MFRFFGSSATVDEDEDEDREDTQVTKLLKRVAEKIAKSRESMDETCEKANELEEQLTKPGSYPKLKEAISEPPEEESGTAE